MGQEPSRCHARAARALLLHASARPLSSPRRCYGAPWVPRGAAENARVARDLPKSSRVEGEGGGPRRRGTECVLRLFTKRYFPLSTYLGSSALPRRTTGRPYTLPCLALLTAGRPPDDSNVLEASLDPAWCTGSCPAHRGALRLSKLGFAPPSFCSRRLAFFVIEISRSRLGALSLFASRPLDSFCN